MLSYCSITPFCWATKTRPSAAQRIVVGEFRPEKTVVSVNPGGSERATIRLCAAAEVNGWAADAALAPNRSTSAPASAAQRARRRGQTRPAAGWLGIQAKLGHRGRAPPTPWFRPEALIM